MLVFVYVHKGNATFGRKLHTNLLKEVKNKIIRLWHRNEDIHL